MKENKWTEIEQLSFNLEYARCVLSADAGGGTVGGRTHNDKIFVFDIGGDNEYKLKECTIKVLGIFPEIVLMGGEIKHELLVIGWIEKDLKQKN